MKLVTLIIFKILHIVNLNFFTSKIPAFATISIFYIPGLIAEKIRSYWPFLKNILHFHWSNSYSALIVKRVNLTNTSSLSHKVPSYFENWVMWFKGANFWKNEKQKIRQILLYIFHISLLLWIEWKWISVYKLRNFYINISKD